MTGLDAPQTDRFIRHLQLRFGITTLVETGTNTGVSTAHAARIFERVLTIDIRNDWQPEARARCIALQNVEFLEGDSRQLLGDVVATLDRPALFWLDAHAAPGLYGDRDDWPALDELDAIMRSPFLHFILIDDAHCFSPGSPYPACPSIEQVREKAAAGGYSCEVKHDVIVLLPASVAFGETVYFD